jgi:cytochrome c553
MNRTFKTLLAVAALVPAPLFAAADQLIPVCESCHGPGGAKPISPTYPALAGQYANYLEHALMAYRSGARKNPVMGAQASTLSDEDIKALALYFSQQQGPLYTPTLPGAGEPAIPPKPEAPKAEAPKP